MFDWVDPCWLSGGPGLKYRAGVLPAFFVVFHSTYRHMSGWHLKLHDRFLTFRRRCIIECRDAAGRWYYCSYLPAASSVDRKRTNWSVAHKGNATAPSTELAGYCVNLKAPCVLYIGQAFRYSPENAFYIFNQQIYFIIWYLLDGASLI